VENFVNIFSTRATLLLFSKFSAPTITFLAFWLAKKLRPCWIWSDYNQLALRARWLFYHFISNSGSWNNCYFIVTYVSAIWFTKFSYRELWKSMIFLQRQSFSSYFLLVFCHGAVSVWIVPFAQNLYTKSDFKGFLETRFIKPL